MRDEQEKKPSKENDTDNPPEKNEDEVVHCRQVPECCCGCRIPGYEYGGFKP